MRRTAEDVCIEYAKNALEINELSKKISPSECVKAKIAWESRDVQSLIPCISQLFSLRVENGDQDAYIEQMEDIEENMCDCCKESLKAVRDRKIARLRFGAAKRSVLAVGKRLMKEKKV